MKYSDQIAQEQKKSNGWVMVVLILIIPIAFYWILFDGIYSWYRDGLYFMFERKYDVDTDEAMSYAKRLAFFATVSTVATVVAGIFWSKKAYYLTALLILFSVLFGLLKSHNIREERLTSIDNSGKQRYVCLDSSDGPYAMKGDTCRVNKKLGFPVDPEMSWSYLAIADNKRPTKLNPTTEELKSLVLSANGLPLIFVSSTTNREGLYDLYSGGGLGERNQAGTISDILRPANADHISHNLALVSTQERRYLEKILVNQERKTQEARRKLGEIRSAYQNEVSRKAANALIVTVAFGESKAVPSDLWVSVVGEGAQIYVARLKDNAPAAKYDGPLTEEAQEPFSGRLVVTNVKNKCKLFGILLCESASYKLQSKTKEAQAAIKAAELVLNSVVEEEKGIAARLTRVRRIEKEENQSVAPSEEKREQPQPTTTSTISPPLATKAEVDKFPTLYFFIDFYDAEPEKSYYYAANRSSYYVVRNAGGVKVFKTGLCYEVYISVDSENFEKLCGYSRELKQGQRFTIRNQEAFALKSNHFRENK